ncbi:MAG: hypothetical protein U9Q79_07415, partial [Candidatus Hydrogenedentes bacterium]|nr:hypothetical protein [Candidatus Hydrogenedentota bacterium]
KNAIRVVKASRSGGFPLGGRLLNQGKVPGTLIYEQAPVKPEADSVNAEGGIRTRASERSAASQSSNAE